MPFFMRLMAMMLCRAVIDTTNTDRDINPYHAMQRRGERAHLPRVCRYARLLPLQHVFERFYV